MIETIELFAGVGGFRIGLEGWKGKSASSNFSKHLKSNFTVKWSNQFEPSTKIQHANLVYNNNWPNSNHSEENIEDVVENKFKSIPDHDLLVGGFPCQDYSVAKPLSNSKGLVGEKGVLWWSIYNILRKKGAKKPKYLFLENVDRLLLSGGNQKGRDFAVILSCLYELGYAVEWRVINAADYGMPQRRRRVYLIAYHKKSNIFKEINSSDISSIIGSESIMAKAFPVKIHSEIFSGKISKSFDIVSNEFNLNGKSSPFQNSGIMINGNFHTTKSKAYYNGAYKKLKDIITKKDVEDKFYISKNEKVAEKVIEQIDGSLISINTVLDKWKYLKGRKNQWKVNSFGIKYKYNEGSIIFPDCTDKPSRTIVTTEGGKSPSRLKHVIETIDGRYRRLTPIELEKLNMFPENHTLLNNITDNKRAFFMGNALVVGVIEKIGLELSKRHIKLNS